jgi:hypothetical protein
VKPGRIPCINPACRRTAPAEKCPGCDQIICRGCFRALPAAVRARHRALDRRGRRLNRLTEKALARHTRCYGWLRDLWALYDRLCDRNWRQIRDHYLRPARPAGLDPHLEELGLA